MNGILRRIVAVLACAASVLCFGGCQVLDVFSVDSLIRPPKLTGENALIQSAFEQAVGTDVTLVNPLQGEYRSAFVFYDYDNDGVDETVVFYTRAEAQGEIRMHFLDFEDGQWRSVADLSGNGSTVFEVEFCNLDSDKIAELAVTWTVSDSRRNKTLSVYRCGTTNGDDSGFLQLSAVQNMDHLILDFDFDGSKEILYLFSDTSTQSQVVKAGIMKLDAPTGTFVPVSEVELSRMVENPVQCTYDIRAGKCRVYYDFLNFDDTYMTELLVFDSATSALTRPQDGEGQYLCQRTIRNDAVFCTNAFGTGFVDVPVFDPLEGSGEYDSETGVSAALYVMTFMHLDQDGFIPSSDPYYCDAEDGILFRLTDYLETFNLIHRTRERVLAFYRKETPDDISFSVKFSDGSVAGGEYFRITIFENTPDGGLREEDIRNHIEQLQR